MTVAARHPRSAAAATPWGPGALAVATGGGGVGAVLIAVGWVGSSGTTHWSQQVSWTVLAGVGVVLGGWASAWWLLRSLRAVRIRSARLARVVLQNVPDAAVAAPGPVSLVVVRRGDLVHASSCPMVRGKEVRELPEDERSALTACGVCKP